MEVLVKMSIQKDKLLTIVQMAKELNLSESRIRAILGKDGSPAPVSYGQFYGGGRTANLYNFEEFRSFYKTCLSKKGKEDRKASNPPVDFNKRASSFLRGSL